MFSVGQKVVLVDDKWPESVKQLYLQLPVVDTVYVVRAVRVGRTQSNMSTPASITSRMPSASPMPMK